MEMESLHRSAMPRSLAMFSKKANHQHFEIDRRINSRAAPATVRIRRRTELTNFVGKSKRSQRLFQFGVERSCRGLNEPCRDNEEFGLRQGLSA